MGISFDKERALYPELWKGCLRAFNPLGIYSYAFDNVYDKRGVYPDYASGKHGYIYNNTTYANNTYVRPNVYKGVYCTQHFENVLDHITFPDTGLPIVAENVTLSMWLNPHAYSAGPGFSVAMTYGDNRSGGGGAWYKSAYIGFNSDGLLGGTYASGIVIAPWSEFQYKWIHVVLTKAGTAVRGYMNGVLRSTGTLDGSNTTLWGTGYIGVNNDFGMRYPYIGYIGVSSIHNRIVSDQEIQLLASDPQVMYEQESGFRYQEALEVSNGFMIGTWL